MNIFKHTDGDGDYADVRSYPGQGGNFLRIHVQAVGGSGEAADVDREAALRLYNALGEWLYPAHTPDVPNKSLIEQMIAKAVEDLTTAVLPLHLKTVETVTPERPCNALLRPGKRLMDPCPSCGFPWVWHLPAYPLPPQASPPTPEECPGGTPLGCTDPAHAGPADPEEPAEHGRLMTELPRRTRPRLQMAWDDVLWGGQPSGHCGACGHAWVGHIGHTRVCDATLGKGKCGCTRQPGAS